ncbi:protein EDS1 [Lactuca sativa]|uniref:Fungal lipase-like domain-containing protein n=1 Tax=Lactuca sativa TaxID=4236 RepID=A0A9R1VEM0_LACSA|nr:protein EDS1 [Lactuca sativa]KAJ0204976.1 hypothetical protein LSAT_V11C500235250 [Lactuca sativa]
MEVEKESVKLSLSNELTKTAQSLSMEAHKQNKPFITNLNKKPSMEVAIFAFPGSWEVSNWYHGDLFGETEVDRKLFKSLCRIGENRPAKVNAAFLKRFQDLLNDSTFKSEIEKAVNAKKKILFTGHLYGGATASFATLWMLDEYIKKRGKKFPIGCVTFGSPLIGDRTLSHAVRREKWAGHFTHFVMEHDIVPRMMLSPKISIQQQLPSILKFFQQKVKPNDHKRKKPSARQPMDEDQSIGDAECVEFFENVIINASTVASHVAFELMEPTNSLMEKLSVDFVKVSPYRPSGFYVFCTSHSQQFRVENPNAVLQLLFYFLQLTDENQKLVDFAYKSFSYEEELKNGLHLENLVDLKDLNDKLLTPNGTAGDAVRTSNEALFQLSTSARCCIIAAEEAENRKEENQRVIDKSLRREQSQSRTESKMIGDILSEIRNYKDSNVDYYEAFKLQNEKADFQANMNRLELAKIWDVIVEMVMREDLPDEFEGREDWVEVGTVFRRLVEPLDIANYYRHLKGDGYMKYRPKRYKFTQRWYEHANCMDFDEVVCESSFVAEVEEIKKQVFETKKKSVEKGKEEVESMDKRVEKWRSDDKIQKQDVFWGESILSMLREKVKL